MIRNLDSGGFRCKVGRNGLLLSKLTKDTDLSAPLRSLLMDEIARDRVRKHDVEMSGCQRKSCKGVFEKRSESELCLVDELGPEVFLPAKIGNQFWADL